MRNLVLGIALVVCLDVAFIWTIANQSESTEIAHAVTPHAALPVVHQPQFVEPIAIDDSTDPADEPFDMVEYRPEGAREVKRSLQGTTSFRPPAPRSFETREVEDPSFDAKRLFPDKVIIVGEAEPAFQAPASRSPEPTEAMSEAKAHETRQPESLELRKRSFESRALGVIKKPYTWMRTLASKFR